MENKMKDKIYSFKNKTITIDQLMKLSGRMEYLSFLALINKYVNEGVLAPVIASGKNGRSPALFNKYRIITINKHENDLEDIKRLFPSFNIPRMHDIKIVETIDEDSEDLIVIVDASDLSLVCDDTDSIINTKKPIVVIDHHQQVTNSHDLVINEERSSATEQITFSFKEILGKNFKLTNEIAELGQHGINADTGRFLYETTYSVNDLL